MNHFVDFGVDGNISGFYVDEIHGENIPETAIPITGEQWQQYSADARKYKLDGDVIREKTQEEIDDELASLPPVPPSDTERITQLEADNALLALSLAESQARLAATEQGQADLLLQLVQGGVL